LSDLLYEPIFDLDLLAWKGKLISGVVRRRVNPADPNDGHIIVKNNEILNQGKKIVKIFNLSWLYDCDFMLDKKGNPVIIEINPRASGSSSVSIAAGVPLYDNLISLAKKKKLLNQRIPYGTKIIAFKSLKKITN
jgi:predicted ATP-grasp superfamily ATP-dependent carboligase